MRQEGIKGRCSGVLVQELQNLILDEAFPLALFEFPSESIEHNFAMYIMETIPIKFDVSSFSINTLIFEIRKKTKKTENHV